MTNLSSISEAYGNTDIDFRINEKQHFFFQKYMSYKSIAAIMVERRVRQISHSE